MFLIIVSFTKDNSISSAGRSCPAELEQWKSFSVWVQVPRNRHAVHAVCTVYTVHTVPAVHTVRTVHIVHTLHAVHAVRTVHTVCAVPAVCTVHAVHAVCTVCAVRAVCAVCTVRTVCAVHAVCTVCAWGPEGLCSAPLYCPGSSTWVFVLQLELK